MFLCWHLGQHGKKNRATKTISHNLETVFITFININDILSYLLDRKQTYLYI